MRGESDDRPTDQPADDRPKFGMQASAMSNEYMCELWALLEGYVHHCIIVSHPNVKSIALWILSIWKMAVENALVSLVETSPMK